MTFRCHPVSASIVPPRHPSRRRSRQDHTAIGVNALNHHPDRHVLSRLGSVWKCVSRPSGCAGFPPTISPFRLWRHDGTKCRPRMSTGPRWSRVPVGHARRDVGPSLVGAVAQRSTRGVGASHLPHPHLLAQHARPHLRPVDVAEGVRRHPLGPGGAPHGNASSSPPATRSGAKPRMS